MRGTPIWSRVVVFAAVALVGLPSPTAAAPSFEVLGDFFPAGVSDDGNVVAGTWIDPALERGLVIARWTPSTGVRTAGYAPEHEHTSAHAISGDGATILGVDYNATMLVWTAGGGIQYPAGTTGSPGGISRDGSVLVGGHVGGAPFRWTAGAGAVPLPTPVGWADGSGAAVSADGAIVAGTLFGTAGRRAFRWTGAGGTSLLDLPAGITDTHTNSISDDGSTVVGWAADAAGVNQPFRWTAAGGMQLLGHLPSFPGTPTVPPRESQATGVSADGSVIIGNDAVASPASEAVAFIWDEAHGMRDLKSALASDYGLALPGWTLFAATGITPDGMTIVGMGSHPEFGPNVAWRVVLPEPGTGAALLGMACLSLRRRRRA